MCDGSFGIIPRPGALKAGLRVLVAEDETLAAMVIEDALTELGCTVLLAGDGQEALDMATRTGFDILLTDLAMPHMGGLELIPRLRARQPSLPVVVMTGYLSPNGARQLAAPAEGPLAVLHKPFAISQLVDALARVAAPAATLASAA